MSRIHKLEQTDIKQLAIEAMKSEVKRMEGLNSSNGTLGYVESQSLDDCFNQQFVDVYEMVTLDSVRDSGKEYRGG